jgi:RimK family alpha-L-glutamate ligase
MTAQPTTTEPLSVRQVRDLGRGRTAVVIRTARRPRTRRAYVLAGRATPTNRALARALSEHGLDARIGPVDAVTDPQPGDLAIGRLDVLPTLDGVEPGLWQTPRLERHGVQILNGPLSLLASHDKLSTALLLGRVGVPQPRTAHVREVRVPRSFAPPYVVKPRFGSWGHEVVRCDDEDALLAHLPGLSARRWFRRQGALVQELVPTGSDLRLIVSGGRVVEAIERRALPGEWRTNVALGGSRHSLTPPAAARVLALRAAAAVCGDLVGVDLLRCADGRYVVLEVNGAVDFTTDYRVDGCDPFQAAVDALLEAVDDPASVGQAVAVSAHAAGEHGVRTGSFLGRTSRPHIARIGINTGVDSASRRPS